MLQTRDTVRRVDLFNAANARVEKCALRLRRTNPGYEAAFISVPQGTFQGWEHVPWVNVSVYNAVAPRLEVLRSMVLRH